ncbi:MAG: phosphoribosylamine--glycine ligase [Muribaculaceae bacterium]|nr:phosphoribosylamine--glycine ligase [Muribaculaceae bacterium]MDE6447760.1 phosphoribosylamine--glycine ligase [Muribaculaceae bacterium]
MSINNKEQQTVMVVGSGGRCHAIVDALSRSPRVRKIFCAPGNAGIAAQAECVAIQPTDVEGLLKFATENGVDFTVVGPEAALAVGIVDAFTAAGKRIFGPTREAARIESSKEFAKQLMVKYGIPTGYYEVFTDFEPAWEYVRQRPLPAVIKYDGLAAGKGVVVAVSYEEAEQALRDMLLDATFGKGKVIVEEFLDGPEFSFMCVASGEKVYPLALAQDHKRAYDGDRGPNTGGMGAYSPVPFISEEVRAEALEKILKPTAAAMVKEGVPFTGVLYGGLILTKDGPKVIEFNARFGDPETEVVLPRLESDILDLFEAAVDGTDCELRWSPKARLGVVMASEGYPGAYAKGSVIEGLDKVEGKVYHMGTALDAEGRTVTAGGRVLMVVGEGDTVAEANAAALRDVERIECPTLFHRTDIGHQAL